MIYTTIVSAEIAQANLANWAIVDCRFDLRDDGWGRQQYRAAHVPGAVYVSLNEDLAGDRTATSGRHPLPSTDALARLFSRLGIDGETQVVAYDQDSGLFASRLWWSLRYLGHDAVAVLDGGWAQWLREARPTRDGDESRTARAFIARPRPALAVSVDDVVARLGSPDALLVDARGPERFEGREEPLDAVAGHIPGAANHFYRWNLTDQGTLRPADELRETYTTLLGGHRPEQAIAYCGSGVSACHNLLAMEHAGLHGTPLYVGSWSEWSRDPGRPVETGPRPSASTQP
jgi:thiosulfate/3-mercaptopyruvate sulfurtransferase